MTAIDNTPNNRNFMSPLNFKFQIKKTPNVNFFIQKVNVPEITLPDATSSTPLVNVPYPGDHLIYGTLNITFKVDEDFQNYMEIHNWMKALGKPKEYEQYAAIEKLPQYSGLGIYSDISVIALNSAKLANYEFVYTDAWPTRLSQLEFTSTDNSVDYMTASAVFKYTLYEITRIR